MTKSLKENEKEKQKLENYFNAPHELHIYFHQDKKIHGYEPVSDSGFSSGSAMKYFAVITVKTVLGNGNLGPDYTIEAPIDAASLGEAIKRHDAAADEAVKKWGERMRIKP